MLMRNKLNFIPALGMALLLSGHYSSALADTTITNAGLWVGDIILQNVNETVSGIKADNSLYSPDPAVPTPVAAPAHMKIIFHVDRVGQVRLLKGVAMVNTNSPINQTGTNSTLICNPTHYQKYGNVSGSRITAVAFDFGDPSGESALNQIADAAANAAVNGQDPLVAATAMQNSLNSSITTNTPAAYSAFLQSTLFQNSASLAATAATSSLVGADADTQAIKLKIATSSAVVALLNANLFTAADALTLYQVPMNGQIAPGGYLTNSIYLGADHPTNPFRHKFNPIHQHGYAITRALTINFDSASSSNAVGVAGFGVNVITGTYREEITGLHKRLGPNQNIGLITTGSIRLNRISPVDTLDQ